MKYLECVPRDLSGKGLIVHSLHALDSSVALAYISWCFASDTGPVVVGPRNPCERRALGDRYSGRFAGVVACVSSNTMLMLGNVRCPLVPWTE